VEDVNRDPVVIFDGLTKSHRYPGWRLGWALGPPRVVEAIARTASALDGGPSRIVQRAALEALLVQRVEQETNALRENFCRKRNLMVRELEAMGIRFARKPAGTFYCWTSLILHTSPMASPMVSSFAGCLTQSPEASALSLLGLCDDSQSTYLPGPAGAPKRIRQAYNGDCYNSATEWGLDLAERVLEEGDLLPLDSWSETAELFEQTVRDILCRSRLPCLLGGDHAVTVPAVRAFDCLEKPLHVIQFDAHPDLYPEYEGDRSSHACTGICLLEMEHVVSLTQIGIRASNALQREVGSHHSDRLRVFDAGASFNLADLKRWIPEGSDLYITLDLDALDPAFAPGVSHPVPGGLFPRDLLGFLTPPFPWRLAGIDVVEVNPDRDVGDRTALLAARMLHHAMGLMIEQEGG